MGSLTLKCYTLGKLTGTDNYYVASRIINIFINVYSAKCFLVLWYEVFSDQNLILMVAYAHSICSVVKSQILWKYIRTLKASF